MLNKNGTELGSDSVSSLFLHAVSSAPRVALTEKSMLQILLVSPALKKVAFGTHGPSGKLQTVYRVK